MDWSLIATSNDGVILKACLASSPCFNHARDFNVMRGFPSMGAAYNSGVRKATGEVLVFAHQDVYLPEGWDEQLARALTCLSRRDPNWGVLGFWGIALDLERRGFCYCTGLQKVLGGPFADPIECISVDGSLLVLRRSAGLMFDEHLPGRHLYDADICLTARQRGMKCYIIPAFCIHNTAGLKFLPWAFWRSYFYMRRKWWDQLPIETPCTRIERVPIQVVEHPLRCVYSHWIKGREVGKRVRDPRALYDELVRSGQVGQGTGFRPSPA